MIVVRQWLGIVQNRGKQIYHALRVVPAWIYILGAGIIVFTTATIEIAPDMGWYMDAALNMYLGRGYTEMDGTMIAIRAPLFPLLIAMCFKLFGVSPWSAYLVVRFFAVAAPVLLYFFGKKLYNERVGCMTALLMLTSYSLCYWSNFHIDAVWPTLVIGAVYATLEGFQQEKKRYVVLAGIAMGCAFLVKEVALLFVGMPFLMWLVGQEYRTRRHMGLVVLYAAVFCMMILPWEGYMMLRSPASHIIGVVINDAWMSLVHPTMTAGQSKEHCALFCTMPGWLYALKEYLQTIAYSFIVAPFFIIAWLWAISNWKDVSTRIVLLLGLCFLPLVLYLGAKDLRIGQSVLVLWLSYLVLAKLITTIAGAGPAWLCRYGVAPVSVRWWLSRSALVLFCALIALQFFARHHHDKGMLRFLKTTVLYRLLESHTLSTKVLAPYDAVSREVAQWLRDTVPADSRVLVSRAREGRSLYFYSQGHCRVEAMDVARIQYPRTNTPSASRPDDIIFVTAWSKHIHAQNYLWILSKTAFEKQVSGTSPIYCIVSPERHYLARYFSQQKCFTCVQELGGGAYKIYQLNGPLVLQAMPPLISKRAIAYLNALRKRDQEKYVWYRDRVCRAMGLTVPLFEEMFAVTWLNTPHERYVAENVRY